MSASSTISEEVLGRRYQAEQWFGDLQRRICVELERLETEAPACTFSESPGRFEFKPWVKATGSGGGTGGFLAGRLFEKGGVHVSAATSKFSPEMAATMPGAKEDPSYVSASISLIIHPRSPRVPTVHMNTRFLSTAMSWFGGGADLTPMISEQRRADAEDTVDFHAAMKEACDAFNLEWHPRFKSWCDEYFYLPHRNETRGTGGIFFDQLNTGDFGQDFAFTRAVGEAFLKVYPIIVRRRMKEPWTESERAEQLARRGRYVEFNLLYDRGTMFGLRTGANVETMLSSMPPIAAWPS